MTRGGSVAFTPAVRNMSQRKAPAARARFCSVPRMSPKMEPERLVRNERTTSVGQLCSASRVQFAAQHRQAWSQEIAPGTTGALRSRMFSGLERELYWICDPGCTTNCQCVCACGIGAWRPASLIHPLFTAGRANRPLQSRNYASTGH